MPAHAHPGRTSLWIVGATGLIAVAGAATFAAWSGGESPPPPVPPLLGPDPAWAKREAEIRGHVAALLAAPPAPDDGPPHPIESVPANTNPDTSAFRFAQDLRVYDLRAWKPLSAGDAPRDCIVVMSRRVRAAKLAPADRLDILGRTSGSDLALRCEGPNPEKARLYDSQAKPVVQGSEMTEHRLSVDVSDTPVGGEFDLRTKTTYRGSLQTPGEQWFGTIGYDGSTLLSMLILFPELRPFQGGGLRFGPVDGELAPYDGTQVVFKGPGGSWVYWEVPAPRAGYTYRVDWKW